jgi:hypothetical protein
MIANTVLSYHVAGSDILKYITVDQRASCRLGPNGSFRRLGERHRWERIYFLTLKE